MEYKVPVVAPCQVQKATGVEIVRALNSYLTGSEPPSSSRVSSRDYGYVVGLEQNAIKCPKSPSNDEPLDRETVLSSSAQSVFFFKASKALIK